jgi:F420-dependent oxidoreductase-like protein
MRATHRCRRTVTIATVDELLSKREALERSPRRAMRLGVHVVRFDVPGGTSSIAPTLARVGEVAESVGIDSLSVMDHYFQMDQMLPAEQPMLEGYTTLGFLAAHTSKARLGLLVTGVTYRHPGLLAKIVATLDALSGGRADLGIGAAWYEREHRGLGVRFPSVAERFERLEETLQICLQMWSDVVGRFDGRHYQLAETLCVPAPISRPHPPITIGGTGERKTLRLVAQYGDACNFFTSTPPEIAHKLEVLHRHCDDVGRAEDTIAKTILYTDDALAVGDHDRFLSEMAQYRRIGIEKVIVMPTSDGDPARWIDDACGPVAVRLAELG